MSLYDIGDLIFQETDTTGRLVCDGSQFSSETYPALAAILGVPELVYDFTQPYLTTPDAKDIFGHGAAWSSDGRYLAVSHTGSSDGGYTVIDTTTWEIIPNTPRIKGAWGRGISWSPDGRYLAIATNKSDFYDGGGYTVIDTTTWTLVTTPDAKNSYGDDVAWSPDGRYLAVAHPNVGAYTLIDTTAWTLVTTPDAKGNSGDGVSWSPDSRYLAVATNGGGGYTVIDTTTWTLVTTPDIAIYKSGDGVAWSPDSRYLAVTFSGGGGYTVIDTTTWSIVITPYAKNGAGYGVAWSPDSRYLAVATYGGGGGYTVFPIRGMTIPDYIPLPDISNNPRIPGLPVLIQAEEYVPVPGDGYFFGASPPKITKFATRDYILGIAHSPDMQYFAYYDYLNNGDSSIVSIYRTEDMSLHHQFTVYSYINRLIWSPNSKYLGMEYSYDSDQYMSAILILDTLEVWNYTTMDQTRMPTYEVMDFHPDGEMVLYPADHGVISSNVLEIGNRNSIANIFNGAGRCTWSKDASYVAGIGYNGEVQIMDFPPTMQYADGYGYQLSDQRPHWISDKKLLHCKKGWRHEDGVQIYFIEFYEIDAEKKTFEVSSTADTETSGVDLVGYSPEGDYVLIESYPSHRVMSRHTGEIVLDLGGSLMDVTWSPDGQYIYTVKTDNSGAIFARHRVRYSPL